MSISMLVFTHSEVGTEQKVIKLKLKIDIGSIKGVRCKQVLCVYITRFDLPYLEGQEFVLPSLTQFRYYCRTSGSFVIFQAILLLPPSFAFASSVVVVANYSYTLCCLGHLGKRFVWQELNITFTHAMLLYDTWNIRMIALRLWIITNLRKGWELNLLNKKDVYCLHHSVACAFNHDHIVHTYENHFENKLWLFISIRSPCV